MLQCINYEKNHGLSQPNRAIGYRYFLRGNTQTNTDNKSQPCSLPSVISRICILSFP